MVDTTPRQNITVEQDCSDSHALYSLAHCSLQGGASRVRSTHVSEPQGLGMSLHCSGVALGIIVGRLVGVDVGEGVGCGVGLSVGVADVGKVDGVVDGNRVGEYDGRCDGDTDGDLDGCVVGEEEDMVGDRETKLGAVEG